MQIVIRKAKAVQIEWPRLQREEGRLSIYVFISLGRAFFSLGKVIDGL